MDKKGGGHDVDDKVVPHGSAGGKPTGSGLQHRENFDARGSWTWHRAGNVRSPTGR